MVNALAKNEEAHEVASTIQRFHLRSTAFLSNRFCKIRMATLYCWALESEEQVVPEHCQHRDLGKMGRITAMTHRLWTWTL
jgi:hypothetical protein